MKEINIAEILENFPSCGYSNIGFAQCIPYKGNKHLLGTINDCDNYYKTWK